MYVVFKAQQPISHAAFTGIDKGNVTEFRRMPLLMDNGMVEVPTISGNAIGGVMRRQAFRELYEAADFSYNEEFASNFIGDAKSKRAWDRLYAALFFGGTIDKAEVDINTDMLRDLRSDFPALSLLGSALYSVMLSGTIMKGFALPFCAETLNGGFWHSPRPTKHIPTVTEIVSDIGFTRHIDRENADTENSGVKPMPYEVETVNAGTFFEFQIDFSVIARPIEKDCAAHIINNLVTHLGGGSGKGFGGISIVSEVPESGEYANYLQEIKNDQYSFRQKLVELAKVIS